MSSDSTKHAFQTLDWKLNLNSAGDVLKSSTMGGLNFMMYSEEASQISGNGSIVGFQIIEIQCNAVNAKRE